MIEKLMVSNSKMFKVDDDKDMPEIKSIITKEDYDLVPINDEPISMYYLKETMQKRMINYDNTIDINTSIKPLLNKLSIQNNLFVTENGIVVGMISVSDLNSKEFSLWLYRYFIDIEKDLGEYIKNNIEENEIVRYMKNCNNDCFKRYTDDLKNNINNNPIEYLYFKDLLSVIKKNDLFTVFECESKKQFEKFNSLNELRNSIMHASKSFVKSSKDILKLLERIEKMEMLQFYLKTRLNVN